MPSKMPMGGYGAVHCPPEKKGVTQLMMNPREFKMIQVMTMRFSHARGSSTVRPEREKFIISSAAAAVTMAAMVEMARIWGVGVLHYLAGLCPDRVGRKSRLTEQRGRGDTQIGQERAASRVKPAPGSVRGWRFVLFQWKTSFFRWLLS